MEIFFFWSQVKELIKLLWEKEAKFFSYLSDIQRQGVGAKADHSMFFLETLLVPPIKFRPPSKGGDSVRTYHFKYKKKKERKVALLPSLRPIC